MVLMGALVVLVMATVRTGAPRDFDAMERRRKQAAKMFNRGRS